MEPDREGAYSSKAPEQEASSPHNQPMRWSAFFGSIVLDGFGHFMVGYVKRGIYWFVSIWSLAFVIVAFIMLRMPAQVVAFILCLTLGLRLASIVDAVICGGRPRSQFRGSARRACLIGLAYMVNCVVGLVAASTLRATMFELFTIPTNAMMPAVIGSTMIGKCPHCQQPAPVSASRFRNEFRINEPLVARDWHQEIPAGPCGICVHCGKEMDASAYPPDRELPHVTSGDRIVVNKIMRPRRWDIITFQFPADPNLKYLMRLVGLPGETVAIQNGELVINGQIVPKPSHLKYLHYFAAAEMPLVPFQSDVPDKGVTLGPDEYYVLGDFSHQSNDSRLFREGAAGHPPYAIPADHIVGVATHIYWPMNRWRVFERAENE